MAVLLPTSVIGRRVVTGAHGVSVLDFTGQILLRLTRRPTVLSLRGAHRLVLSPCLHDRSDGCSIFVVNCIGHWLLPILRSNVSRSGLLSTGDAASAAPRGFHRERRSE